VLGAVDGYAALPVYGVVVGPYKLPDKGTHTISLQVSGRKSIWSYGFDVALDNFIVINAEGSGQ
jgi:hypothetical protein